MERDMIIVLSAIALFLTAGTFAALAIFNILKSRKQRAFIFFSIGISCVTTYIIGMFIFLHLYGG